MLYTISKIAKEYKYPVKTLRTRVFKSKVGKIINGIRYLNEEEKEYLINPSFHKMGRKKSLKEKPLKPIKKEKSLKKPKILKDSKIRKGQYTKIRNFELRLKEIIQDSQDYRKYCLKAREELAKDISFLSCFSSITLFSQYRKVINHMILQFPDLKKDLSEIQENVFRIPLELSEACKRQQQENLYKKLSSQKPLPLPVSEFKELLKNLLNSENFKDNLLAVFLATGRRTSEILTKGSFSLSSKPSLFTNLKMQGVLKKKSDASDTITFPILCEASCVLNIIGKQRSHEKISYHRLYFHLKKYYPFLASKPHELRSLYGAYSYLILGKEKKINPNVWLNQVLGHENSNLLSSFHYSFFQL